MNTQPEALLCAEMLEVARDTPTWADYSEIPKEACRRSAAELRRQHAELREANETFGRRQVWWNDRMFALERQRDALLEALRALVSNEGLNPYSYLDKDIGTATAAGQRWLNARAAIKAVEEGK